MNKIEEIKIPKFILGNEPTNLNSFDYIYSPHYLSLILVIEENSQDVVLNEETRKKPQKVFKYDALEQFRFVLVQNNVEETGGLLSPEISVDEFLNQAWAWYRDYLLWEEKQINE